MTHTTEKEMEMANNSRNVRKAYDIAVNYQFALAEAYERSRVVPQRFPGSVGKLVQFVRQHVATVGS